MYSNICGQWIHFIGKTFREWEAQFTKMNLVKKRAYKPFGENEFPQNFFKNIFQQTTVLGFIAYLPVTIIWKEGFETPIFLHSFIFLN